MSQKTPLTGLELVDCAKANATSGIAIACERCGYANQTGAFLDALKVACAEMGIEIHELGDLITEQQSILETKGIEIAPDTTSEL